jgi:surface protein
MNYIKRAMYEFDDLLQTGIDQVPSNNIVFIASTNEIYSLDRVTGLTSETTILQAIDDNNLVQTVSKGKGVWIHLEGDYKASPSSDNHILIPIKKDEEMTLHLELSLSSGDPDLTTDVYQFSVVIPATSSNIQKYFIMNGVKVSDNTQVTKDIHIYVDIFSEFLKIDLRGPSTGEAIFTGAYLIIGSDTGASPTEDGWVPGDTDIPTFLMTVQTETLPQFDVVGGQVTITDLTDGWYEVRSDQNIESIRFKDDASNANTRKVEIKYCGSLTSFEKMFYTPNNPMPDLVSIKFLDTANTSDVINMNSMFRGLTGLGSLDIEHMSSLNVTNFSRMFMKCTNLSQLNISNLNTSSATTTSYMFNLCTSLSSLDLSTFDTSSLSDTNSMFRGCTSLTILDLSDFKTYGNTAMQYMFAGCSALRSIIMPEDIQTTKPIANMSGMFKNCSSLECLTEHDTTRATDKTEMFDNCPKLQEPNSTAITDLTDSDGATWTNSEDCPLPVLELEIPQQSTTLNLTDFISANNTTRSYYKIKLINNLIQPPFITGDFDGLSSVELVNNGEIQGGQSGGDALTVEASLILTNNGSIKGAGGKGGKGGKGGQGPEKEKEIIEETDMDADDDITGCSRFGATSSVNCNESGCTTSGISIRGTLYYDRVEQVVDRLICADDDNASTDPTEDTVVYNVEGAKVKFGARGGYLCSAASPGATPSWYLTEAYTCKTTTICNIDGGEGGNGGNGGEGQYFNHPPVNGGEGSPGTRTYSNECNAYSSYGYKGGTGGKGGDWGTQGREGSSGENGVLGAPGGQPGKAITGESLLQTGSLLGTLIPPLDTERK